MLLSMSLPGQAQRQQQWSFNSTLPSDDNFVKFMQEEMTFFLPVNLFPGVSNSVIWDALKAYLPGQIIAYTAHIERENYNQKLYLFANQLRGFKAKQSVSNIRMLSGQITTGPLLINDTLKKIQSASHFPSRY